MICKSYIFQFCPKLDLIKDKIPVLGLDIVERQVWLYSSKKLARAWFCPSFRENQERINDSGIRMRKEEMCLGRGLGTRPMQGVFNEEPRETLASSDKEAHTKFSFCSQLHFTRPTFLYSCDDFSGFTETGTSSVVSH